MTGPSPRDRLVELAQRSGDGSVVTQVDRGRLQEDWVRACRAACEVGAINLHGEDGFTPAHALARRACHLQLFDAAAAAGMDFGIGCSTGERILPIHSAAIRDQPDDAHAARIIDWLVTHANSSVNAAIRTGWQPLHLACSRPDPARVGVLVRHGAELETELEPETRALTPLLIAADASTAEVIAVLLDAGADASARSISNAGRRTAYGLALSNGLISSDDPILNRLLREQKARRSQKPTFPDVKRRRHLCDS